MDFKATYKGYEINHNTESYRNYYSTDCDGQRLEAGTWDKLKAKIDGIERKNFVRTKCIKPASWRSGDKSYAPCEVTSHAELDEAWTVDPNGKRERVSCNRLFIDNGDTRGKLTEVALIEKDIKQKESEIKAIIDSIQRYSF